MAVPAAFPLVYGGRTGLDAVRVVLDLQVNPGSLPALPPGKNIIRNTDEGAAGREVKVSYKWRERQGGKPEAPAGARCSLRMELKSKIRRQDLSGYRHAARKAPGSQLTASS